MMRSSQRSGILLLVPLLAVTLGCGGGGGVDSGRDETTFALRPFQVSGHAVCYGPHRDGQRPGGASPSRAQIREDLHLMAPHWTALRTYGATGSAETILEVIRQDGLDLKVMLGAWIAPDDTAANRREVEAAITLAGAYPEIVTSVCVGNETQVDWSAHRSPLVDVIRYVRQVRGAVTQPVTSADDYKYWVEPGSRELSSELDFVTTHAHPLWNGQQLEDGLSWMKAQTAAVKALHAGRPVVIGETGWATAYHDEGEQGRLIQGQTGEQEQARFHDQVRAWAEAEGEIVFWFEAFDENWKGGPHPDEVEKHWGLFHADRTPKAALAS